MTDPALVHVDGEPGAVGTHVLIIGVGAYDHLIGGGNEKPEIADGMGQLGSPPRSARALADWFLGGGFQNPERPLRSLSLVISEANAAPDYPQKSNIEAHELPDGSKDAVVQAIDGWAERAAANQGNLALFYFTGHGVTAVEPLLLCRDYGRHPGARYRGSINFEGLRAAMETRAPDHQLYVLDACRTPASILNRVMGAAHLGDSVLEPGDQPAARQSVHFASSSLAPTYARRAGVSFYTDALIDALDGGGAQVDLEWWVGTNGLQTALGAYTERSARLEDVQQEPDRLRAPLFKIHKPARIRVPIYVTCDPEAVWGGPMTLEAKSEEAQASLHHDPGQAPERREWSDVLPSDKYMLTASFAGGGYEPARKSFMVVPPSAPCTLQVKAKP